MLNLIVIIYSILQIGIIIYFFVVRPRELDREYNRRIDAIYNMSKNPQNQI